MSIYLLSIVDPFSSANIPLTILFSNYNNARKYILEDINNSLEEQKNYISGLKGVKDIHMEKYREFLYENDEVYFYGEYKDYYNTLEPYEIKYKIELKEIYN